MEFTFRCNLTKCRAELQHQAVVTTCSHIFCIQCASNSGLANTVGGVRICPACKAQLVNKDDAVITQLDPSEDYKSSVLSGFTPTLIVECASRALNFYNYQAVHEATYQEFLARRLTEKVTGLNTLLDETINSANGHIHKLQEALRESQGRVADIESKNEEIQHAFKQKAKALNDVTRKYDLLKSEKMAAQTMNAASDEAEQVMLGFAGTNSFSGLYNPGAGTGFRRPISGGSGGSPQNTMSRLYSLRRHPAPGPLHSSGYSAQDTTRTNPLLMTPHAQRDTLNVVNYRQPLGDLPVNSYTRSSNSAYSMTAGAKAGKRPLRAVVGTPRINRHAGASDLPIR